MEIGPIVAELWKLNYYIVALEAPSNSIQKPVTQYTFLRDRLIGRTKCLVSLTIWQGNSYLSQTSSRVSLIPQLWSDKPAGPKKHSALLYCEGIEICLTLIVLAKFFNFSVNCQYAQKCFYLTLSIHCHMQLNLLWSFTAVYTACCNNMYA